FPTLKRMIDAPKNLSLFASFKRGKVYYFRISRGLLLLPIANNALIFGSLIQALLQHSAATVEPTHHRTYWTRYRIGNFVVTESPNITEHHHGAEFVRQSIQGSKNIIT